MWFFCEFLFYLQSQPGQISPWIYHSLHPPSCTRVVLIFILTCDQAIFVAFFSDFSARKWKMASLKVICGWLVLLRNTNDKGCKGSKWFSSNSSIVVFFLRLLSQFTMWRTSWACGHETGFRSSSWSLRGQGGLQDGRIGSCPNDKKRKSQ